MSDDSLRERGQALEDMFFRDRDKKLLEKLRGDLQAKESRQALAAATGMQDEASLDRLLEHGISAETLTSVGLIPLVAVAWADGVMEDKEREAILKAAEQSGISPDQASFQIVSSWLDQRPSDQLLDSWKEYIRAMKPAIDDTAMAQLESSVISRARGVAEAAGGFLGFGNKISDVEQKVLDDLAGAFE